mmetsp:Transcript_11431/g.47885  ORF Transcript_11431/g.47885 Transcript_11431/m.47885 type:complete len:291 (-) Transcript_11431:583-1455(-)
MRPLARAHALRQVDLGCVALAEVQGVGRHVVEDGFVDVLTRQAFLLVCCALVACVLPRLLLGDTLEGWQVAGLEDAPVAVAEHQCGLLQLAGVRAGHVHLADGTRGGVQAVELVVLWCELEHGRQPPIALLDALLHGGVDAEQLSRGLELAPGTDGDVGLDGHKENLLELGSDDRVHEGDPLGIVLMPLLYVKVACFGHLETHDAVKLRRRRLRRALRAILLVFLVARALVRNPLRRRPALVRDVLVDHMVTLWHGLRLHPHVRQVEAPVLELPHEEFRVVEIERVVALA